jgi:DNA-binding response OmpR family regulator
LAGRAFEAAVLDGQLPDGDGLALARHIRTHGTAMAGRG